MSLPPARLVATRTGWRRMAAVFPAFRDSRMDTVSLYAGRP
jgi:hypothetical protein